jgi:hypothetical protein
LRILFDKNVPVGVRRFLLKHEVHTVVDLKWHPQLENGELLAAAEDAAIAGSYDFIEMPLPPPTNN